MVDVFKTLDIDYLAMNCASSFRGLHEAVLNHNNNKPEILTCPHEEIAVAMAHGYAKIEGKPMAFICHGVVGLQHATMAMYNAWCDRVPVYCMGGNIVEADKRMPGAEWVHSAIDIGALTRDFTKWDDQPTSLQHFAESAVRAYKVAMTPPMGPVLLSLDAELQENPIHDAETLRIPKLGRIDRRRSAIPARWPKPRRCWLRPRTRSSSATAWRGRRPASTRLVELAETLQCAVIDNAGRMNFPARHPLNMSFRRGPVLAQADVMLALEMNDLWGVLNQFSDRVERSYRPVTKKGAKVVTLGTARPLHQGELPGLRALARGRSRDCRRRRGVAAGAHRAGQAAARRWPQVRVRDARQEARFGAARHDGAGEVRRDARLGREPDHDRADVRRGLCPDQGRGLVAGRQRHPQRLAAPAVGHEEVLPVERRLGRCRHRLQPAGLDWCGARQQAAWPADGRLRRRRRFQLRAGRAVDRGASPDPAALCGPQQPRLSPGGDVSPGHGGAP